LGRSGETDPNRYRGLPQSAKIGGRRCRGATSAGANLLPPRIEGVAGGAYLSRLRK
jgi:hypothetical protein